MLSDLSHHHSFQVGTHFLYPFLDNLPFQCVSWGSDSSYYFSLMLASTLCHLENKSILYREFMPRMIIWFSTAWDLFQTRVPAISGKFSNCHKLSILGGCMFDMSELDVIHSPIFHGVYILQMLKNSLCCKGSSVSGM